MESHRCVGGIQRRTPFCISLVNRSKWTSWETHLHGRPLDISRSPSISNGDLLPPSSVGWWVGRGHVRTCLRSASACTHTCAGRKWQGYLPHETVACIPEDDRCSEKEPERNPSVCLESHFLPGSVAPGCGVETRQ